MNPLVLNISIPASAFAVAANSREEIADGPLPDVPELRVLDRYTGQWEDEIAGKPGVKRTESGGWILNGRFLRQCWSTDAGEGVPKACGMTVLTFDVERKTYRSWSFLATGSVIENEGVWDASACTFTWRHRLPETSETVIAKTAFVDDATQTWSIVKTDAQGKVVREIEGRSHRTNLSILAAA